MFATRLASANHCSFHAQGGPWPHIASHRPTVPNFPHHSTCRLRPSSSPKVPTPQAKPIPIPPGTSLHDHLQAAGIARLFVGGLATDYCVPSHVKDACRLNYAVYLLIDAIRAVNVLPDDGPRAEESMVSAGAIPLLGATGRMNATSGSSSPTYTNSRWRKPTSPRT